jgi:Domain of unknown function (DUF4832)/Beta-galactosidase
LLPDGSSHDIHYASAGVQSSFESSAMKLLIFCCAAAAFAQTSVVVRPVEIDDLLVNPEMGIQTFQRVNGDAINPGMRWSEAGPETAPESAAARPDFPETSLAYYRWFWSQLEPQPGKYVWSAIDLAIERARAHNQTLDLRLMPYDEAHPLPEWYRNSGARRVNKDTDEDGKVWSPDADDPAYAKQWSAFVAAAGKRYNGHPDVDTVDISTVGYWGEGWGPHLPDWSVQQKLIDEYFEVFDRTRLLMNFDEPHALAHGTERGAGWRLDCWGDLGGRGKTFMHMLDFYPQQVVRTGIEDVWRRSPVSLETCGTPLSWKRWGYTDKQLQYIFDQALRWHATSINIKSTAIPEEWRPAFREFAKKIGYRYILRRLEYPAAAKAGAMIPVSMWWLNAGVAPVYGDYWLGMRIGNTVIRVPVDVRKWLPGDAVFDGPLYLPETLAAGKQRVQVAMISAHTGMPAIRLAIEGRQADGWYDLGTIEIGHP